MPTEFLDRFEVPELLRLPAWADPQVVRSATAVAIVVSLIALFLAIRIIRRLLLKAVVVVLPVQLPKKKKWLPQEQKLKKK